MNEVWNLRNLEIYESKRAMTNSNDKNRRLMMRTFAVICIALLIVLIAFEYNRHRRAEVPSVVLIVQNPVKDVDAVGIRSIAELLANDEDKVCVLPEYGSIKNLASELNEAQSKSLTQLNIEPEDLTWHMFFFSGSLLTRAFVVERYNHMSLGSASRHCYKTGDNYVLEKERVKDGELKRITFVTTKQGE